MKILGYVALLPASVKVLSPIDDSNYEGKKKKVGVQPKAKDKKVEATKNKMRKGVHRGRKEDQYPDRKVSSIRNIALFEKEQK